MIIKKGCNFESDYEDGVLRILLKGEIDHHSAVSVRSAIDEKIYGLRPKKLVMDLSRIDFMDSSGLGLILGRYSAIKEVGGELVVLNPNAGVVKILKLAGAERIIRIENVDVESEQQYQNKNKLKGRKIR